MDVFLEDLVESGPDALVAMSAAALVVLVGAVLLLLGPVSLPRSHRVGDFGGYRRRVLVTGAASGVGRQLVGVLLHAGHSVLATDADFRSLKAAADSDGWLDDADFAQLAPAAASKRGRGGGRDDARVSLRPLDVSTCSDWESTARHAEQWMGGIDVLLSCAGIAEHISDVSDLSEEDVDAHLDATVRGAVHGTRIVGALMRRHLESDCLPQGGHIVNFASTSALAPAPATAMAVAAQYAVRGFSLCASKDLASLGIYVTVVCTDAADDVVAKVVTAKVLPRRPREVRVLSGLWAGLAARFADYLHASRLMYYAEKAAARRQSARHHKRDHKRD